MRFNATLQNTDTGKNSTTFYLSLGTKEIMNDI